MNFTFGIITGGGSESRINFIINTIERENIPENSYQVLIVGNCNVNRKNTRVIPFDERMRSMWITRKKNIITYEALFENIVYMHDYICLDHGWYEGFKKFGNDFKICMNKMIRPNGERYRDWTLWAGDASDFGAPTHQCLLPYDFTGLSKHMYISGAYWVAKKDVMLTYPLDESLTWGYGEDVEWSKRVREVFEFKMNALSSVRLMKEKDPIFKLLDENMLNKLRNYIK